MFFEVFGISGIPKELPMPLWALRLENHKVPENGTTSENSQSPRKHFPHLKILQSPRNRQSTPSLTSNLSVSFTSLWAFSLCVVYLSVSFTSLCLETCVALQKPEKINGFSRFLRFQAFLESFKSQDGPTKNIKKQKFLFRFLGFQAFLESFQCQDCLTENIKNQCFFRFLGGSGLLESFKSQDGPTKKH